MSALRGWSTKNHWATPAIRSTFHEGKSKCRPLAQKWPQSLLEQAREELDSLREETGRMRRGSVRWICERYGLPYPLSGHMAGVFAGDNRSTEWSHLTP